MTACISGRVVTFMLLEGVRVSVGKCVLTSACGYVYSVSMYLSAIAIGSSSRSCVACDPASETLET